MKVSVIIPFVRPDGAKRCMEAVKANAGISADDYEILAEGDEDRIGCPKMVKKLVEQSRHECVLFLGDDTYPYADFIKNALDAMATLPDGWGMVGLNDLVHDGNILATHWLAHKNLLPLLDGEFFHTGYLHCFCDQELIFRCKALGRYTWCKDAMLYHDHPMLTGQGNDADYKRVYSPELYRHDEELFKSRCKR